MIRDHLGNEFSSITSLCKYYHVNRTTFTNRIKAGMSIEDALLQDARSYECTDHLGNTFDSINKMCEYYNIDVNTYKTRIKRGVPQEEALLGEAKKPSDKGTECFDHLGNKYRSYSEMARAYEIPPSVLRDRLAKGMSIEAALQKRTVTDHLGKEYKSERKMCEAYGLDITTYKGRLKRGMTQSEALTSPKLDAKEMFGETCTDHLGRTFRSVREMCEANGIDCSTFRHRIKMGESLSDALSQNELFDHKGNKFRSELEMCKAYHIDNSTFRYRRREGFSIEEALSIPKHYSLGEYRVAKILDDMCNKKIIEAFVHNVQIKKLFELLDMNTEYNNFMNKYEAELNQSGIYISRKRLAKFRFDFTIINNQQIFAFIEYDGVQHFKFVDLFFKSLEEFFMGITRDKAKTFFAEINNIPLLRIRYDQIDELTVRSMIEDLVHNPSKYLYQHNTYLSNEEYMSIFDDDNSLDTPFAAEVVVE